MNQEEFVKRMLKAEKKMADVFEVLVSRTRKSPAKLRREAIAAATKIFISMRDDFLKYSDSETFKVFAKAMRELADTMTDDALLGDKLEARPIEVVIGSTRTEQAANDFKTEFNEQVVGETLDQAYKYNARTIDQIVALRKRFAREIETLDTVPKAVRVPTAEYSYLQNIKGAKSFQQLRDQVEKQMKQILDTRGNVLFRDRGNKRWTYRRYAFAITQHYETETYREGQIVAALNYGEDLVRIDVTHNDPDSCEQYERQIISLTGVTPGFDVYADLKANKDHIFSFGCQHGIELLSISEKDKALSEKGLITQPQE